MNAPLRAGALLLLTLATLTGYSQDNKNKLGYVDVGTVLQNLPAYKDAQKKLQGYIVQMQQQLTAMQKEDSTKIIAYQKDEPTLASPIKEIRQQEIVDLEDRIQKLQQSSQDQISQKQAELLKPLQDTLMTAIKAVADEKKYTYVFNSSIGSMLLYYPPSDDISDFVKAKLGVK